MAAAAAGAAGGSVELMRMDTDPGVYHRPPPTPGTVSQQQRLMARSKSIKKSIAEFFLGEDDTEITKQKWRTRCQNLHTNKVVGGRMKDDEMSMARSYDTLDNSVFAADSHHGDELKAAFAVGRRTPQPIDPLARSRRFDSRSSKGSHYGYGNAFSRQYSHISTVSSSRRSTRATVSRKNCKDSVLKMAIEGFKNAGRGHLKSTKKPTNSRSFAPGSISSFCDDMESIKSPAIDSVMSPEDYVDDVFFNTPAPTSPRVDLYYYRTKPPLPNVPAPSAADNKPADLPTIQERSRISEISEEAGHKEDQGDGRYPEDYVEKVPPAGARPKIAPAGDLEEVQPATGFLKPERQRPPPLTIPPSGVPITVSVEPDRPHETTTRPVRGGWQSGRLGPQPIPGTPDFLGMDDLEEVDPADFVDNIEKFGHVLKDAVYDWNNSDRREVGKGFVGKLFDREYKDDLSPEIQKRIENMDEHRPFFTYWATFIQVVIYIVAVSVYGIAPIGFEETQITSEVLLPTLAIESVSYFERDNLWIGPREADLIHLGAKYSPCMRSDDHVVNAIKNDRISENQTACCIRNDGSGCVQAASHECSSTLSSWYKWTETSPGPDQRVSGSVCGQDPRFCKNPFSSGSFTWDDDITLWPVCLEGIKASNRNENVHMTCSVVGRPCCVGIQGECLITTREFCDFRKGYFHEEATLCSQVDCMGEICGMIPFRITEKPDQFYRLWTSLFLHAGLFQVIVTILFQFFVMRDVEKLAGWLRTSIIYIGSGIAGSLASAIFLPYYVEAGPAGSQFGIIGCLFAELLQNFTVIKHPWWAVLKQVLLLLVLFVIGLLPYVDNYAHLFGFFLGFLLSFAFLPFIDFNKCDRTCKIVGIIICLVLAIGLFVFLTILFYVIPIYNCPNCHYFNCIPFTPKFCNDMEIRIGPRGTQLAPQ